MTTTTSPEVQAREILRGDWDADGVVSVHLPREAARTLLQQLGYKLPAEGRFGRDPIVAPSGERYWETDEALKVALVTKALS